MKKPFYKNTSFWRRLTLILFVIFIVLSFRPIINPKEKDCTKMILVLEDYKYIKKNRDVYLKIRGSYKKYYLNNIIEEDLNFEDLDAMKGKEIIIYAVNHWTLLDPMSKRKHIARITTKDEKKIIYTEF